MLDNNDNDMLQNAFKLFENPESRHDGDILIITRITDRNDHNNAPFGRTARMHCLGQTVLDDRKSYNDSY